MKSYCINLRRRPDRWRFMSQQFKRLGLEVERFEAIEGKRLSPDVVGAKRPGGIACTMSHLAIIREAQRRGEPAIMLFEDDAVLCKDFNQRLALFLRTVPVGWDMLFLGISSITNEIQITQNVHRLVNGWTTHAYILRRKMFAAVIESMSPQPCREPDEYYNALMPDHKCYVFLPCLSYQRDDWSDIKERFRRDEDRFRGLYEDDLLGCGEGSA
jgi:GR25 family glycosyltransferase involved in LPS biosynthesis